jgi:predicted AlkP superfamily phosphohydrolase/phosphomutase
MFSEPWGMENEYQSFPGELVSEMARAVPGWFSRSPLHELPEGDYQTLEEKLLFDLCARFEALRYLMRHHSTDFTFIVFPEIDTAQHHFWHFMDGSHPWHDPLTKSPFEQTILRCYQHVDMMLAQLLDQMSSDTCLAIYSDHGFGPLAYDVFINSWLVENGFMALKKAIPNKSPIINRVALGRLARRLGLRWLTQRLPERMKSRIPTLRDEFEGIDWERTRAYFSSLASQSLMVNLRGREPFGVVSPGREYHQICEQVMAGLKTLQHAETKQSIVAEVYHREEIYHGTFVDRAPDIIAQCAPPFQLQHGFNSPLIQTASGVAPRSGTHAAQGMALLWGGKIKPKIGLEAHIADIAPTVLHAFGLPVPDMDGRILHEAFDSSCELNLVASLAESDSSYSPEQERKITERLRRLGYL